MAWPYQFVNLSPDQISERRKLLDRYGFYAWLSPIILLYSIYLGRFLLDRRSKTTPPFSSSKTPTFFQTNLRRLSWILNSPISSDFGTVKVYLIGLIYTSWLLYLTIHQTGTDYMHFTKRLGHVAVSQLPLQYLLSIKSPLSPIQVATNLTHETLNPYHRLAGRIIHLFLLAHAVLYLNFFYFMSALPRRLYDRDVQFGLLSIALLTLLAIKASPSTRKKAYHKDFYIPHSILSFLLMPAISAHVPYARKYILQTLILYLFNVATRKANTTSLTTPATINPVEGTNGALLHISIPAPPIPFGSPIPTHSPGQHIYLKAGQNPTFPRSPFTIASAPPILLLPQTPEGEKVYRGETIPDMELVVRNLGGPTTAWLAGTGVDANTNPSKHQHANRNMTPNGLLATDPPTRKLTLLFEGPYGSSSTFIPALLSAISNPTSPFHSQHEEVLLLAGGIGATFTLPIYVSLLRCVRMAGEAAAATAAAGSGQGDGKPDDGYADRFATAVCKRIHFHWIVRSREEAGWGIEYLRNAESKAEGNAQTRQQQQQEHHHHFNPPTPSSSSSSSSSTTTTTTPLNAKIFITRPSKPHPALNPNLKPDPNNPFHILHKLHPTAPIITTTTTTTTTTTPPPKTDTHPPLPPLPLPHGVEIIPPPHSNSDRSNSDRSNSDRSNSDRSSSTSSSRPSMSAIINPVFDPTKHHHITVLTCAAPSLTHALRSQVGRHVMRQGREVGWWEEGFGMGGGGG